MLAKIKRAIPLLALSLLGLFGLASCGGGDSSGGGGSGPTASAGCYFIPGARFSFDWDGGSGPERAELHSNGSCSAPTGTVRVWVVAVSSTQALDRCGNGFTSVAEISTTPELGGAASFFRCQP